MSFESIAPSEPTIKDGPTGWEPVRRAVWVDGVLNDPSVESKGWGVEMAFPWSLLKQVREWGGMMSWRVACAQAGAGGCWLGVAGRDGCSPRCCLYAPCLCPEGCVRHHQALTCSLHTTGCMTWMCMRRAPLLLGPGCQQRLPSQSRGPVAHQLQQGPGEQCPVQYRPPCPAGTTASQVVINSALWHD
jgi:hypothetical protein